jgi:hypothetical protein
LHAKKVSIKAPFAKIKVSFLTFLAIVKINLKNEIILTGPRGISEIFGRGKEYTWVYVITSLPIPLSVSHSANLEVKIAGPPICGG